MRPYRILLLLFWCCLGTAVRAQQENMPETAADSAKSSKTTLNGYLSDLFSPQYNNLENRWKVTNFLHQRLNFSRSLSDHLVFTAQLRSRLIFNQEGADTAFVNGYDGVVWQSGKMYFNTLPDRLNLKYTQKKFEVTVGRQRINWGQSFVWNPNDLFNSYSFFDFDYIERPGSDAVRVQYYNSFTSSTELAAKIDRNKKVTVAGLHRFNRFGWDFQLLGGVLAGDALAAGAGFTGNIRSMSLYGEASWFKPFKNFADTTGMAMIDLGCSKTFGNNLSLQLEGLYVSREMDISNLMGYFQGSLDVRKIAFARVNLFGSLSYPISPLVNGSLAVMWFPETTGIHGFYTGPSLDFSLGNNLGLSVIAQYFKGSFPATVARQLPRQTLLLSFVRLKWNF